MQIDLTDDELDLLIELINNYVDMTGMAYNEHEGIEIYRVRKKLIQQLKGENTN